MIGINALWAFSLTVGTNIFKNVRNADLKIADNNKFKQIFENQNEGVIIISNDKTQIEYVNNKFLKEFKSEILEIYN